MPEEAPTLGYCEMCLHEAISDTKSGTINDVDLTKVPRSSKCCVRCSHYYCDMHASPVDQESQCLGCLPLDTIETRHLPLKDDEGVTHRGKIIQPIGIHYRTLPKAISNLTDEELAKFIEKTASLIHTTEQIQDYRRIGLSTARLEQGDREAVKARQLRGITAALPKAIKVTGSKGSGTQTQPKFDIASFIQFVKENKGKITKPSTAAIPSKPEAGAAPPPVGATESKSAPLKEAPASPREQMIEDLLEGKEES